MPVDPKVASRIRKLLALAGSPEPNESASARASALRLMSRHGVTEEEVAAAGAEFVEIFLGWRGFDSAWKFDLASVAARARACEALGLRAGKRRRVRVVGRRRDAEAAVELFRYLLRELDRLARDEMADVVPVLRVRFPTHVRRFAACYLGEFREGAVAGFSRSLRSASAAGAPPPRAAGRRGCPGEVRRGRGARAPGGQGCPGGLPRRGSTGGPPRQLRGGGHRLRLGLEAGPAGPPPAIGVNRC